MSRTLVYSGIDWIGKIPSSWSVCKVKNKYDYHKKIAGEYSDNYERIALTLNGVVKRDKDDANGLQPENYDSYQLVYKGDLIFKLIDLENVNTSRIGKSDYEGITSPAYIVLTPKEHNNYGTYYFLNMWYQEIFNNIGGNGVRSALNKQDLLGIPYLNVPKEEQKRIADYLDEKCSKIDKTIEDNNKAIELLKEYKEQKLIEFLKPYKTIKLKYLLSSNKDMRVGPFGSQLTNSDYVPQSDFWVYNQRTVLDNNYDNNDTFISEEKYNEMISFSVEEGDILLTTRGSIGKISIVPKNHPVGIIHPCIIKFKLKDYNEILLKHIFNDTSLITNQLQIMSNSTTIDVVYSYNLREVELPSIPKNEQIDLVNKISNICYKLDKVIKYREMIIEKLEEYKKSLIYEVITGKKEV